MARKPKNVMFRTSKQRIGNDTKKFAAILIGCVLTVLAVSIFAILSKNDFNVKNIIGGDAPTETVPEELITQEAEIEASKTYLFWCADDSGTELRFAWLVNFELPARKASVCTLDLNRRIVFENQEQSMRHIFRQKGIKTLVSCIENGTEIEIDGHIGSDDESFKSMINYLGGIDITVPEQIDYRSGDLNVLLVKGKQNLKGDTLFKYLRYLGTLDEKGRKLQASAMNEILDYVFKPSNINRCSYIFSKISNSLETDLTIVDYSSAEQGIKLLVENGFATKRIVETPEDLF